MSLQELEKAVAQLSPGELDTFSQWFEEFLAEAWDRQIERDAVAGRLDGAIRQADDDFESGRCTPRRTILPLPAFGSITVSFPTRCENWPTSLLSS